MSQHLAWMLKVRMGKGFFFIFFFLAGKAQRVVDVLRQCLSVII